MEEEDESELINRYELPLHVIDSHVGKKVKPKEKKECTNCFVEFVAKYQRKLCFYCTASNTEKDFRKKMIDKFGKNYWKERNAY